MASSGFNDLTMDEKLELFVSTKVKRLFSCIGETARVLDGGYVRGAGIVAVRIFCQLDDGFSQPMVSARVNAGFFLTRAAEKIKTQA